MNFIYTIFPFLRPRIEDLQQIIIHNTIYVPQSENDISELLTIKIIN